MAKMEIKAGGIYDVVSPGELDKATAKIERRFDDFVRESVRGLKVMRSVAAPVIPASGDLTAVIPGPESGFAWVVQRVSGLGIDTGDASSAVLGLYRTSDGQPYARNYIDTVPVNAGAFFGSKSVFLLPNESLVISGTGLTNTTTPVTFNAEVIEAPAEMIGKLL